MKFIVSLSGFLLIFLLPHWTQSVENEMVDINTLARIINFFEQNYKRVDENDNHPRQYATVINVPKDQCLAGFQPSQNNFLTHEDANMVKNKISDESDALYLGQQLIAAGTRTVKNTNNKNKYSIHSESLLLNPSDNSPMKKLLDENKQDCSVFYTYNSPCFDTCLNKTRQSCILTALENWSKHAGIKAFVFNDFWKFDVEKDLESKFKEIASLVPLYRCVSESECYPCKGEGNTPIDTNCLPQVN